jgi:hypothetical protein
MSADIPPLVAHKITPEGKRILDQVSRTGLMISF